MFDLKATFLVVDDFEAMRKVTVNQLRSLGVVNVLTAINGVEALRILQGQHVDMVLSDWNMPIMSGLELLKEMRADHSFDAIPFIMITAEAERSQIEDAIASGVTDLMLKPYTPSRLTTQIEKAFLQIKRRRPASKVVETPLSKPDFVETRADAPKPTALGSVSDLPLVLIVDDVPDNLMLLSHMFRDSYRVRLAQNGAKALAWCQSDTPPDLVLLDVMMPDMDGFEVLQRMREHPTSVNIPVIFVTSMTAEEGRAKGLELGAVDYVTKPVDPDTLKLRVKNFMRYVSVQRQLQASYDDMLEMSRLREQVEHIARHDIKGPLAGAIGILQGVLTDKCEHASELEVVEETIMQVLSMVNLSEELLKIETGKFHLRAAPVNIDRLLRRIVETTQTVFANKEITILLDFDLKNTNADSVEALGEATFCYSIFQNILKNACEAAPPQSKVSINVHVETDIRIEVKNHGAVPKVIREHFFDKFVTHGKHQGTGLGTYSARLLTEAQNGTIQMQVSDVEDATVITVHLPKV